MKKRKNKAVWLFNLFGLLPLLTVAVFYLLILRVYLWNGFELPYWKHPLKSEIPFFYHNQSIFLLTFLSKYIAIPCSILLLVYLAFSHKIKLIQNNPTIAITIGLIFYIIMEFLDPLGVYDWWID